MEIQVNDATDWHDDSDCCAGSDVATGGGGEGGSEGDACYLHGSGYDGGGGAGGVPSACACFAVPISSEGGASPSQPIAVVAREDSFSPTNASWVVNGITLVVFVFGIVGLIKLIDSFRGDSQ